MNRPPELFAVTALALLALGLASPKWPSLNATGIAVRGYVISPQICLFGIAALFAVVAFVYSLWMLQMNRTAAIWHFWISAVAALLFCIDLVILARMRGTQSTASVWPIFGMLVASVFLFIGGQLVFAINLAFAMLRQNATP